MKNKVKYPHPIKVEGDIAYVINEGDMRLFVNQKTGDIAVGYKYGHGARCIKFEDLVKLAWVLDYGNEINKLTHVNLPPDYPTERLKERAKKLAGIEG